jgi:uncharacterized oligopeptide transporter (OPT) family protein
MTGRRISLPRTTEQRSMRTSSGQFSMRKWATLVAVMAVAAVVVIALITIVDASKHFLAPQEHAGAMILGDAGQSKSERSLKRSPRCESEASITPSFYVFCGDLLPSDSPRNA